MIDFWKLVKDFKPGDTVQRFALGHGDLSPFVGRVTAVHKGIGYVDVQWPYGNERMSAEEIVRVNPQFAKYLPPSLDFSYYAGYDVTMARQAAKLGNLWRTDALPATFYVDLASLWTKSADEVATYDELWHRYGHTTDDEILRSEVAKFYRLARNASEMRIQAFAHRSASYWVAQNRQFRVTQEELLTKRPSCPKCGKAMRKTTYKMEKGARARLFACPKCLFLLKRDNLLGPDGAPVEW